MKKKQKRFFEFVDMDGGNPVKILATSQREATKALAEAEGAWVFTNIPTRRCGCPGHG